MRRRSQKRTRNEGENDEEEQEDILDILNKDSDSTLYSMNNHVYFNNVIANQSAFSLKKELRSLEMKLKIKSMTLGIEPQPIFLHITTNGGDIHSALSLVDCIKHISLPVYTVVDGFVASAGTLISLAGEKRFIMPNNYMLLHELRSGVVWGKMTSINEEYTNLKQIMNHIVEYYVQNTKMTKVVLEKILKKDIIWDATKCIKKGLVDEMYK